MLQFRQLVYRPFTLTYEPDSIAETIFGVTTSMEVFTPEAVLELLSTLIPLLSRPPFSSSTLEKVAWKYSIHLYLHPALMKYCSLQLGSLCKGLVKVGGHLERTNPSALSRLQVVQWHAFWSMAFYGTEMLWGFCYHLVFFRFCWPIFAKTPAWTLFWDCSCWRSFLLIRTVGGRFYWYGL